MRLKILKGLLILLLFVVVTLINGLLSEGQGGAIPVIILIGMVAFVNAVWKWQPKNDGEDQDKQVLKKD